MNAISWRCRALTGQVLGDEWSLRVHRSAPPHRSGPWGGRGVRAHVASCDSRYRDSLSRSSHSVFGADRVYYSVVPKLWTHTIDEHRNQVRAAILTTTAELIDEQGPLSVTMSAIAERTGIGRGTLYKYFPDVEAILIAWHEQQIAGHLGQLSQLARQPGSARDRVGAVLHAYALIAYDTRGHDGDLTALLHRGHHLAQPQHALHQLIRDLLDEAARAGEIRDDIPPDELTTYCLHALNAAASADSNAAVQRLVALTRSSIQTAR